MGRQEIHCSVDSCYYYDNGDRCAAERIMVRNNPGTAGDTRFEAAELGHVPDAHQSVQTMCETFIPRQRGPKPGIQRLDRTL